MHVVIETRMWLSCTEGFKIHRLSRIRVARMEGCMHAGFTHEGFTHGGLHACRVHARGFMHEGFTHGGFTCTKGSRMRVSCMEGCMCSCARISGFMHEGFTHAGLHGQEGLCMRAVSCPLFVLTRLFGNIVGGTGLHQVPRAFSSVPLGRICMCKCCCMAAVYTAAVSAWLTVNHTKGSMPRELVQLQKEPRILEKYVQAFADEAQLKQARSLKVSPKPFCYELMFSCVCLFRWAFPL